MMGPKTLLLLSLIGVLEVMMVMGRYQGHPMPGAPYKINKSDPNLKRVVLTATHSFNNKSNDVFLFKPSAIHNANSQVVKGVRYIVDFDISRTVCRKQDKNNDLSNCAFQPEGRLHQTFHCHLEVWTIPWQHKSTTEVFNCRP